jgi:hypothetical protein
MGLISNVYSECDILSIRPMCDCVVHRKPQLLMPGHDWPFDPTQIIGLTALRSLHRHESMHIKGPLQSRPVVFVGASRFLTARQR